MSNWFHTLSIRQKLNVITTLTSFVALLVVTTTFLIQDRNQYKTDIEDNAQTLSIVIADNIAAALVFDDNKRATETLESLRSKPHIISATLWNEDYTLFADYHSDKYTYDPQELSIPPSQEGGIIRKADHMLIIQAVTLDNEVVGTLVIAESLEPLTARFFKSVKISIILLILATGLSLLFSNFIQRLFTTRILQLQKAVTAVHNEKNYDLNIENSNDRDEIGSLIDGFNAMAREIRKRDFDLNKANDELEDRVETRTAELKKMAENAQAANRAKTEFLAMMSHELRTPLNPIVALSEHLITDTIIDEDQKESLELILQSGNTLTQLINDILDLSRIEANNLTLEYSVCRLKELFTYIINTLKIQAESKGVTLNYDIPSDVPDMIYTDPQRLRQILFNLAGNSIKFTQTGTVDIRISLTSEDDEDKLLFSVTDSGIGIRDEDFNIIFEPFKQADTSASREHQGAVRCLLVIH